MAENKNVETKNPESILDVISYINNEVLRKMIFNFLNVKQNLAL